MPMSLAKTPIEVWQKKIRKLRKTTKGQSANTEVDLRKLKKGLMDEYNRSDIKSESIELSEQEKVRLREIHLELQNH